MKPVTKLQKALSIGQTVLIEFEKKDGSVRRARVTKNPQNIPLEKRPKGNGERKSTKIITLFDTVKGDWICCYGDKINLVFAPLTIAQERKKRAASERWSTVKKIIANYRFTTSEALKIASGQTINGYHLQNLNFS